jgi:hypothetical protein
MTMNDYPAALSMLGDAIELFRRLDDRFGLGWAYFVRGLLEITLDDLGAAKTDSIDALRIFADANDVTGVVLVLDALAETARRDGDLVRAARLAGASAVHEVAIGAGLATIVALREGWPQGEAESEAEAAARAEGQAMTLPQAIDYALASEGRITATG